jgi:hypothetical protein
VSSGSRALVRDAVTPTWPTSDPGHFTVARTSAESRRGQATRSSPQSARTHLLKPPMKGPYDERTQAATNSFSQQSVPPRDRTAARTKSLRAGAGSRPGAGRIGMRRVIRRRRRQQQFVRRILQYRGHRRRDRHLLGGRRADRSGRAGGGGLHQCRRGHRRPQGEADCPRLAVHAVGSGGRSPAGHLRQARRHHLRRAVTGAAALGATVQPGEYPGTERVHPRLAAVPHACVLVLHPRLYRRPDSAVLPGRGEVPAEGVAQG